MLAAVLLSLLVVSQALHYQPRVAISTHEAFEEYNTFWNKTHATPAERQMRFRNFAAAGAKIAEANKNSPSATFGYTKFADWSAEEFKTLLGFKPHTPVQAGPATEQVAAPGGAINWVARGKTTPIKNQEQCGSCWAFSAVETAESANLMAGRSIPDGAPQEIVDCDRGEAGCNGGDPRQALEWIRQNGLDAQSCYPYEARTGNCQSSRCSPAIHINGVVPVAGNEPAIYDELTRMPLSICCDAEPWQYYTGGILHANQCGYSIDHAIQLVGYEPADGGYWVVRNSWGADWGERGYIYLAYGENTCGITTEVTGATA